MKTIALTLAIAFTFSMLAQQAMACGADNQASITSSEKPTAPTDEGKISEPATAE